MIFRKNAGIKEKGYTATLWFILVLLLYGTFTNYHPKDNYMPSWYLSFSLGLLLFIPLLFIKQPNNKYVEFSAIKKVTFLFFTYLVFVCGVFILLYISLPSAYTTFKGNDFKAKATITKKLESADRLCFLKKFTTFRVHTKLISNTLDKYAIEDLCVQEEFYDSINIGDEIYIQGIESRYGYKVNVVKTDDN